MTVNAMDAGPGPEGEAQAAPFWATYSCFDRVSVIDLAAGCTRALNSVEAARLAWIATRHDQVYEEWAVAAARPGSDADQGHRFTDEMDQLVGEVGALLGRGKTAAHTAIEQALGLRDRLPQVLEMMYEGLISLLIARTLLRRASAVTDPKLVHRYDTIVSHLLGCKLARGHAVVTENDVIRLADGVLAKLDPDAVPAPKTARRRGVWFEQRRDGLVEMMGLLFPEQSNFVAAEMERIARTVCKKDPRTEGERNTDALVAVFEGYDTLGCQCETERCELQVKIPKHASLDPRTQADVTVVLNESTLAGVDDDPGLVDGHPLSAAIIRNLLARINRVIFRPLGTVVEDLTDRVATDVGEQVSATDQAKRPRRRSSTSGPRSRVCGHHRAGYKPSELQARFLRIRYPECVFPGCRVKFDRCQLDHVVERNHRKPHAGGQTRIGNLVPLCQRHHLIKTEQSWLSDVLPDGSVEWHTPTGHAYRTALIQGDLWFPDLDLIEWLEPRRDVKPPTLVAERSTRTEVRNNNRENKRTQYRRERERRDAEYREKHPDAPPRNDPPPF